MLTRSLELLLALSLLAARLPAATTEPSSRPLPATDPATAAALSSPWLPATQPAATQAGLIPSAVLCDAMAWAAHTRDAAVSARLLALNQGPATPTRPSATRAAAGTARSGRTPRPASLPSAARDASPRRPGVLLRPLVIPDDLGSSSLLVGGLARELDHDTYVRSLADRDRPLIANWIEDYPKLLWGQCRHWGVDRRQFLNAMLPQADLALLQPGVSSEFEFRRLQEEYARLQETRANAFERNLLAGPALKFNTPVIFTMPATLDTYDFESERYELKTALAGGAVPLGQLLPESAAFTAQLVPIWEGHGWKSVRLPIPRDRAERLRDEGGQLLIMLQGYVYYPNRTFAEAFGRDVVGSIFLYVSRVTYIAAPAGKPLYILHTVTSAARPF